MKAKNGHCLVLKRKESKKIVWGTLGERSKIYY